MKKSQRLHKIVELNAEQEKQRLIELGQLQSKRQELLNQQQNLNEYYSEYKQRYQNLSHGGVSIAQLLDFRSFINKLDHALSDQEVAIADVDRRIMLAKKKWETQHQKTKSLQKLCDNALNQEIKIENKREQNEQDERASRFGKGGGTGNA
jgi:flagellar FliJ protein